MKTILLTLSILISSFSHGNDQPNVLFISVDDLNDWVGCLGGHPQALTPNMDRLAARGTLFTNAHCAASACNPSRAAVFSGQMPNVTKVWENKSGSIEKLYPKAKLLTTALADGGYKTLGTGKLLHSKSDKKFHEYQSYEQRWSPFSKSEVQYTKKELPSKGTDNPRHMVKDSRGREVVLPLNRMPSDRNPGKPDGESFDWGGFDVPDSDFGDTKITNWAIEQLSKPHEKPIFLGVGYYRPHIPLFAPQRFFERFKDDPGQLPPIQKNDLEDLSEIAKQWAREPVTAGSHATTVKFDQWQKAVEAYLACVTYVDEEIGRLLDALEKSPAAENTVIMLWSDHGWQLGEKEHWGKWTGWERSTRVTLMMVPPKNQAAGFATPGSICKTPVGLIDLYPTLVDFCGLKGSAMLDGDSLLPLLKKPEADFRPATLTMFDEGNASLRNIDWRYIQYADGSEELYNLQDDPNEWTNEAANPKYADVKTEMVAALNAQLATMKAKE